MTQAFRSNAELRSEAFEARWSEELSIREAIGQALPDEKMTAARFWIAGIGYATDGFLKQRNDLLAEVIKLRHDLKRLQAKGDKTR